MVSVFSRKFVLVCGVMFYLGASSEAGVIEQEFSVSGGTQYIADGSELSNNIQGKYGYSSGYMGWGYDGSYMTYEGPADELSRVDLSVTVSIESVDSPGVFGLRSALFTGWNPASYQHSSGAEWFEADGSGSWTETYSYSWSGSSVGGWVSPAYGPGGHFYGEVFSAAESFSWQVTGSLVFHTESSSNPVPGVASILPLLAGGVLCRARRRS